MIIYSSAPSVLLRRDDDDKNVKAKIKDTIQELSISAFSGNQMLMEISLPKTLKVIGPKAFLNCALLSKIRIPVTVKEIRERAFLGCKNLRDVNLPSGLTCIQEESFSRCSKLKMVVIPFGVVVIEHGAFSYCTSLLSCELPMGLKVIESRAFAHCEQLKNIEIPNTVNSLGDQAFIECERSLEVRLGAPKRRFGDLPIHEVCYYQAHYGLATNQKKLDKAIQMHGTAARKSRSRGPLSLFRKNDTRPVHDFAVESLDLLLRLGDGYFVDSFDMTPLHILTLSARPCPSLCKTLLAHFPSDVTSRDHYGNTPIDYACMMNAPIPIMEALLRTQRKQLNSFKDEEQQRYRYYISLTNRYGSIELLLYFTQRYFKRRMKPLGLGLQEEDVLYEIEDLASLPNEVLRGEQLNRLDLFLTEYEEKSKLALLELALWKGKMKSESPLRLGGESWRNTCRVKSGAEIIIPHLLPYFDDGEHSSCNSC